jgi:hypothetical protein
VIGDVLKAIRRQIFKATINIGSSAGNTRNRRMLVDEILDAMAAARNSMRVAPFRNVNNGKFLVTLLIELDPATYEKLREEAIKQERSPAKVLQRYVILGLRDCLTDDVDQSAT